MKNRYIKNSRIIWRGPSLIDGSPIVVVATGLQKNSANAKTGNLVQTWIIRADMSPMAARESGADIAICGECPSRTKYRYINKSGKEIDQAPCYVDLQKALASIWKALQADRYATCSPDDLTALGTGRDIRIGSYGDPAAVPAWVWWSLIAASTGNTGYTHQWSHANPEVRQNARLLQPFVHASVDRAIDGVRARASGWRTFRVVDSESAPRERIEGKCPASREAGRKLDCASCMSCGGTQADGKASRVIVAHGKGVQAWRAMARELESVA